MVQKLEVCSSRGRGSLDGRLLHTHHRSPLSRLFFFQYGEGGMLCMIFLEFVHPYTEPNLAQHKLTFLLHKASIFADVEVHISKNCIRYFIRYCINFIFFTISFGLN